MTISNGSMATQVGVISESDVIETRADRSNYVAYRMARSIYGGNLFSQLGHFAGMGKKALDVACSIKDKLGMGAAHDASPAPHAKGGAMVSRSALKKRMFT